MLTLICNSKALTACLIIVGIVLFVLDYRCISYAFLYGAENARMERFCVGSIFYSGMGLTIFNYFGMTYFCLICSVLAYGVWNKCINKYNLILIVINISEYILVGFGRFAIIRCFGSFVIIYLYERIIVSDNKEFKRSYLGRNVVKMLCYIMVMLLFLVVITMLRMESESITQAIMTTIQHLYIYLVGSFRLLDYALSQDGLVDKLQWGRGAFGAIAKLLSNITIFINGNDISAFSFSLDGAPQIGCYKGNPLHMNAFYSAAIYFWADFGIIGVFAIPMLLGMGVYVLNNQVIMYCTIPGVALLSYLCFVIMVLHMRWDASSPEAFFVIFFLVIANNYVKRKAKMCDERM